MSIVWRAVRVELALWRSILLLLTGRRDGRRPGVTAVGYHRAATGLFVLLLVAGAIEVPALHLIVPWRPLQLTLLGLGVWGSMLAAGLWAAYVVRPYLFSAGGVRLRHGVQRDLRLSWAQIADVRERTVRTWAKPGFGAAVTVEDGRLAYVVHGETTIALRLTEPLSVGGTEVTEVHIGADDPAALAAAIRSHLPEGHGAGDAVAPGPRQL